MASPTLNDAVGWTRGNGTTYPAFGSGQASVSAGSTAVYPALYTAALMPGDDLYVELKLAATPPGGVPQSGPILRGNSTFTQWVALGVANGTIGIYTYTSGTGSGQTTRASVTGQTPASGDSFRLTAIGNSYVATKNGATFGLSWVDTTGVVQQGAAYRYGGLYVQNSSFVASTTLTTPMNIMNQDPLAEKFTQSALWRPSLR